MDSEYIWYTDLSKEFLERDYLLEGQTLDERVDIICNRAAELLNKPDFAKRFKENLKKGWYSLSSPIWSNFGTDRGMPISCVSGETWINTKIDGGKQAKDIKIGDEVLTHKGRYRKVTNIMVTKDRDNIYKLKIGNRMTNLYITENHLVLTNLGWVRVDELNPFVHLVAINKDVETFENNHSINLREYCDYDFLIKEGRICKKGSENVRKDKRVETVSYYSSPISDVNFDSDLAWAFGLWFAEGSLAKNNFKKPNGIRITLNKKESDKAEKWLQVMTSKFGINGGGYVSEVTRNSKINSWRSVSVNSKIIGNLFSSFGNGCKEKTIPQWIIDSPKDILSKFLDGILDGDGSTRKNGTVKITLANPKLILQIYQIGLKLGLGMSLQMQEKAGALASVSHVYTILFRDYKLSKNRTQNSVVAFNDGLYYAPIRNLEITNRKEDVYDFTVEEDHSFSAAGVVLHNCFGSYCEDSMSSIAYTHAEVMMMTKNGGGTSGFFGNLRERGATITNNGKSSGAVHFMQLFDKLISVISQGSSRRGNFAAYLPIDHKDILEFLELRSEGNPIQDMSFGVCVPDYWMQEMIDGDVEKRKVWARVLEVRANTGYPYIFFTDTVNRNTVDVYKDKEMKITHSNLCCEILEPDSDEESFVCDLSSMNIFHYDQWKDTDAVELLTYFLDAVMTEFIEKAKKIKFMERAVRFAERHRALGIGWLGWHSYLQENMIAFESMKAKYVNIEVAKNIKEKAYAASEKLAKEYGEPDLLKGYGRRNTVLLAIAPTKSSSFILGQVSEGIEPHRTNYYIKDLQKGKYTIKNAQLEKLLKSKDKDNHEVWSSILKNGGSVQHLDFLDEHEKNVFKTFAEISPKEIIIQASQRQKYIDQGQSLNLMIHPSIPTREVNALLIEAWKLEIKTLYYQISVNAAQQFSRDILNCVSCQS